MRSHTFNSNKPSRGRSRPSHLSRPHSRTDAPSEQSAVVQRSGNKQRSIVRIDLPQAECSTLMMFKNNQAVSGPGKKRKFPKPSKLNVWKCEDFVISLCSERLTQKFNNLTSRQTSNPNNVPCVFIFSCFQYYFAVPCLLSSCVMSCARARADH